jgi:hypothetical protein
MPAHRCTTTCCTVIVGLGADERVWVPTVFTKNRERLLQAEIAHKFLAEFLNHKEVRGLLSDGTRKALADARDRRECETNAE